MGKNIKRLLSILLVPFVICTTLYLPSNTEVSYASGLSESFNYTGDEQTYTVPQTGLYEIEIYGAGGGDDYTTGAKGGYAKLQYILLEGETLYINVGGKGGSPSQGGYGGYNGGGSSQNGAGGGGATSVAKSSGLLSTIADEDLILVAGGGGGSYHKRDRGYIDTRSLDIGNYPTKYVETCAMPSSGGGLITLPAMWVDYDGVHHHYAYTSADILAGNSNCIDLSVPGSTQVSGAPKGAGQSVQYGGAGGGGYYSGQAKNNQFSGGVGGTGYHTAIQDPDFVCINNLGLTQGTSGNGSCSIKYVGAVQRTITLLLKGAGTYNGSVGPITLIYNIGDTVVLDELVTNPGITFNNWLDVTNGVGVPIGSTFIMGAKNMVIRPDFVGDLTLESTQTSENTLSLSYVEVDNISKYYKGYQSMDGIRFYDISLSALDFDAVGDPITHYDFATTGSSYTSYHYTVPVKGTYHIDMGGCRGGNVYDVISPHYTAYGGSALRTSGDIYLQKGEELWFYVPRSYSDVDCYSNYGVGGGAADVRVGVDDVYHRIMVAAGGANGCCYGYCDRQNPGGGVVNGGSAGIPNGTNSSGYFAYQSNSSTVNYGATQTAGGYGNRSGEVGGFGTYGSSAGADGWYCGGKASVSGGMTARSGASGFVSGYSSCASGSQIPGGGAVQAAHLFTNISVSPYTGTPFATLDLVEYQDSFSSLNMDDIFFKDVDAPNAPMLGEVIYDGESGSAVETVTWSDMGDNGTTLWHYVESYNSETDELLYRSNTVKDTFTSGVAGFYYTFDDVENTTVTKSMSFVEENKLPIDNVTKTYIHVATVDKAGNLSDTYTFRLRNNFTYTVNHYRQGLDGEYTTDASLFETEDITISLPATIEPEFKEYEGFTPPTSPYSLRLENPDDLTETLVIDYYYTRNNYTLDAYIGGEGVASITDGTSTAVPIVMSEGQITHIVETYQYGETIDFSTTLKDGYITPTWEGKSAEYIEQTIYGTSTHLYQYIPLSDANALNISFTMPAYDAELTVWATPATNTAYVVNHWLQLDGGDIEYDENGDVDFSNFELPNMNIDNLTGTTDSKVTPEVRTIVGYTSPEPVEITINGDGTTVLDYLYLKAEHTYSVDIYEQNIEDDDYSYAETLTYSDYYNNTVTPLIEHRAGFTSPTTFCDEDDNEILNPAFVMPDNDTTTFRLYYDRNTGNFATEYYQQNVTGDASIHNTANYTLVDTVTDTYKCGVDVTPDVTEYTGFISPDATTVTIVEGENLVQYWYERDTFDVTFDSDGALGTPPIQTIVYRGKVIEPSVPIKEGHTFSGWFLPDDTLYDFNTEVTEPITLKAKWDIENYTITFYSGNTSVAIRNADYGTQIDSMPSDPYVEGKVFVGWYLEPTFDTSFSGGETIVKNLSIYARFVSDINQINLSSALNVPNQNPFGLKSDAVVTWTDVGTEAQATEIIDESDAISTTVDSHDFYHLADNVVEFAIADLTSRYSLIRSLNAYNIRVEDFNTTNGIYITNRLYRFTTGDIDGVENTKWYNLTDLVSGDEIGQVNDYKSDETLDWYTLVDKYMHGEAIINVVNNTCELTQPGGIPRFRDDFLGVDVYSIYADDPEIPTYAGVDDAVRRLAQAEYSLGYKKAFDLNTAKDEAGIYLLNNTIASYYVTLPNDFKSTNAKGVINAPSAYSLTVLPKGLLVDYNSNRRVMTLEEKGEIFDYSLIDSVDSLTHTSDIDTTNVPKFVDFGIDKDVLGLSITYTGIDDGIRRVAQVQYYKGYDAGYKAGENHFESDPPNLPEYDINIEYHIHNIDNTTDYKVAHSYAEVNAINPNNYSVADRYVSGIKLNNTSVFAGATYNYTGGNHAGHSQGCYTNPSHTHLYQGNYTADGGEKPYQSGCFQRVHYYYAYTDNWVQYYYSTHRCDHIDEGSVEFHESEYGYGHYSYRMWCSCCDYSCNTTGGSGDYGGDQYSGGGHGEHLCLSSRCPYARSENKSEGRTGSSWDSLTYPSAPSGHWYTGLHETSHAYASTCGGSPINTWSVGCGYRQGQVLYVNMTPKMH